MNTYRMQKKTKTEGAQKYSFWHIFGTLKFWQTFFFFSKMNNEKVHVEKVTKT